MTPQPTFTAIVNKGRLNILDETNYRAFLWKMPEGEQVKVEIRRRRRGRSLNQNAWYRGVVLPTIAQATNNDEDDLHEVFKRKFLPPRIVTINGKSYRLPSSTIPTSTAEFGEYIEKIRAWMAMDYGIIIPDPE